MEYGVLVPLLAALGLIGLHELGGGDEKDSVEPEPQPEPEPEPEPEPVRKPARAARAEDPALLSTASRRRHLRALPDATDDDVSTEAGDAGR